MLVTITNASTTPVFLSQFYKILLPSVALQVRRTRSDLEADTILKQLVVAGTITLAFTEEVGDDAAVGLDSALKSYSDGTRPAASTVPTFSAIWNTSDNAPNWSDGTAWRSGAGVVT